MGHEFGGPLGERGVGLNDDKVLGAAIDGVMLDVKRVQFELVDGWRDSSD